MNEYIIYIVEAQVITYHDKIRASNEHRAITTATFHLAKIDWQSGRFYKSHTRDELYKYWEGAYGKRWGVALSSIVEVIHF